MIAICISMLICLFFFFHFKSYVIAPNLSICETYVKAITSSSNSRGCNLGTHCIVESVSLALDPVYFNGKELYSNEIHPGTSAVQIPVKFLSSGFYIWQLKSGNLINKGKLIIARK
jgi:hypothetical protein